MTKPRYEADVAAPSQSGMGSTAEFMRVLREAVLLDAKHVVSHCNGIPHAMLVSLLKPDTLIKFVQLPVCLLR